MIPANGFEVTVRLSLHDKFAKLGTAFRADLFLLITPNPSFRAAETTDRLCIPRESEADTCAIIELSFTPAATNNIEILVYYKVTGHLVPILFEFITQISSYKVVRL